MNYAHWTLGQLSCVGGDYHTFNPPKRPEKRKTYPTPKLDQTYGCFTLRPVYRTGAPLEPPRFLGYLVIYPQSVGFRFWARPLSLTRARAFADRIALDYGLAFETFAQSLARTSSATAQEAA